MSTGRNMWLLLVVLAVAACGRATTPREEVGTTGTITGETTAVNDQDRTLVDKATLDGMTEVQLGEIAQEWAANERVRDFGQRMMQDHRKAADELQSIIQRIGMEMPLKLDDEHQDLVDRLSKLKGRDFDREYMKTMTEAHTKAVELFERETQEGHNTQLKQWAEQTLPTLRKHLEMARDVRSRVDRTTTY